MENARLSANSDDKRHKLEAVLGGIGDGVLVVDTDGGLVLMNPVAARIFAMETEAGRHAPSAASSRLMSWSICWRRPLRLAVLAHS